MPGQPLQRISAFGEGVQLVVRQVDGGAGGVRGADGASWHAAGRPPASTSRRILDVGIDEGAGVFDNDIDQSAVVLFLPLLLLAALPFVMAWLEDGLDGRPLRRPPVLPAIARVRASVRDHRPQWLRR